MILKTCKEKILKKKNVKIVINRGKCSPMVNFGQFGEHQILIQTLPIKLNDKKTPENINAKIVIST